MRYLAIEMSIFFSKPRKSKFHNISGAKHIRDLELFSTELVSSISSLWICSLLFFRFFFALANTINLSSAPAPCSQG